MTRDIRAEVAPAHALYCGLTMQKLDLTLGRMFCWERFLLKFSLDDMKLTINHIKRGIRHGQRNIGALKFSNLIERMDKFEEDLAQARGDQERFSKPRMNPGKAQVLRQTHRESEYQSPVVRSGEVLIKRTEFAAMLKEWKEQNL
jgi:hypothetical protein